MQSRDQLAHLGLPACHSLQLTVTPGSENYIKGERVRTLDGKWMKKVFGNKPMEALQK